MQVGVIQRLIPPIEPASGLRNLILVDNILNCPFLSRQAPAIALPQQFGYQLQWVDCHSPRTAPELDPSREQPTLLQLFIRGNPFRGSAGLNHTAQGWFQALVKSGKLQALVIYGSPYVLEQFLPELPPELPYIFTYGQMPAAQAIALKALFVTPASEAKLLEANQHQQPFTD